MHMCFVTCHTCQVSCLSRVQIRYGQNPIRHDLFVWSVLHARVSPKPGPILNLALVLMHGTRIGELARLVSFASLVSSLGPAVENEAPACRHRRAAPTHSWESGSRRCTRYQLCYGIAGHLMCIETHRMEFRERIFLGNRPSAVQDMLGGASPTSLLRTRAP